MKKKKQEKEKEKKKQTFYPNYFSKKAVDTSFGDIPGLKFLFCLLQFYTRFNC